MSLPPKVASVGVTRMEPKVLNNMNEPLNHHQRMVATTAQRNIEFWGTFTYHCR